jgi:hypothetical protein
VVIIDNLLTCARTASRYDDDVKQWQRIQPWIIREREKGKAFILIHHANKSGLGQLGTVTREAMLNTVVSLRPVYFGHVDGTSFALSFDKHRHFTGCDPLYIEFIADAWSWEPLVDKAVRYFRESGKRLTPIAIASESGVDMRTAHIVARELQKTQSKDDLQRITGVNFDDDDNDDGSGWGDLF